MNCQFPIRNLMHPNFNTYGIAGRARLIHHTVFCLDFFEVGGSCAHSDCFKGSISYQSVHVGSGVTIQIVHHGFQLLRKYLTWSSSQLVLKEGLSSLIIRKWNIDPLFEPSSDGRIQLPRSVGGS